MKKIFQTKTVAAFNREVEKKEIEESLKKLWKQYHLVSGKEKQIIHNYLDKLEDQLRSLEKEDCKILLVGDTETGEKLSNFVGDDTFIILLKSKYKQIEANDKRKRILVNGNNSIYIGPNNLTHKQLMTNVVKHLANQKFSEKEIEEHQSELSIFVKDIMDSKHYFAGRYDSKVKTAYIWDFPTKEIISTLKQKYEDIKEIRY